MSVPDGTPTPGGKWSDYAMQLTPAPDIKSAESIPDYPADKEVIVVPNGFLNQPDNLRFFTDDPVEDVGSFYAVVLPRLGWVLRGDNSENDSVKQAFVWQGKDEMLPYDLLVSISIYDGCLRNPYSSVVDESNLVERTCAEILLLRQPYASRVPLYPDAREVITAEAQLEIRPLFAIRTTRYLTSATPEELTQFYASKMVEYGWRSESINSTANSIEAGLVFTDPTIDDRETMQPQVEIIANKKSGEALEVTITARGPELRIEQSP
jgi:hypothetical protein